MKYLDEIHEHFKKWYPREGCGVLASVRGELEWFPCDNIAEGAEDFVIDSTQYINIGHKADIVAIVHSHPDASSEPSENDIKYCNTVGIPYYIFSYPEMKLNIVQPVRATKSLYGRNYEFGVNDCFEAARDYYLEQGLDIPNRPLFEDDWWDKGLDYFTDEYIATWGFQKVEGNMQKDDLLIFTIRAAVGNHCAVYLGDDIMYHHAENRISNRESVYPFWKKYISGVYRYAA